jgi:FG-GAP-like repeat/Divergent InlB B-repeat domain
MLTAAVVVYAATLAAGLARPAAAELGVVSVTPAPHALTAAADAAIVVRFDRPVARDSVVVRRSFWAFGRWSGTVAGAFRFADGDRTVELRHGRPFSAGEMVTVFLSHDLRATDGSFLRGAGYSFQFWVRAQPAAMDFVEIGRMTTRLDPGSGSRSYGGIATDLDRDGHLDLTIVNEDADDLRVFLNRGDGSGTYDAFLRPPSAAGDQPSPSEPSDFDRDGIADVAVANFGGGVSILRGRGDGRFFPQQFVAAPGEPRGLAVLDADGDGDVDVVHTTKTSNLSLVLNDGAGVFGSPIPVPAGGVAEWALAAADMTGDGILDLVTGDQTTERIYVYAGNGDGTFTQVASRPSGGKTWMLVLGDVDRDGREDVAAVNGPSDTAAILLGTGNGQLAAARVYPNVGFPLATDLGDLDGDGDLDWVTSSFFGAWRIFENRGGSFIFQQQLPASRAASCSLLLDVDNDNDLDLALVDELEDEVVVMRNLAATSVFHLTVLAAGTGSGAVSSAPAGIDCGVACGADFDPGTEVTLSASADAGSLFAGWSGAGCSGRGDCTVVMTESRTVTASFSEEIVCEVDATTLCLRQSRFRVRVRWRDFDGNPGDGHRVLFGSDDSGLLWFFDADNWEMLVKVLDGCGFNGRYWVFSAATTNVEYTLEVTDTATGEVREYVNPLGTRAAAITDVEAFATCP